MCVVGTWVAPLKYYSFHGRSVVFGCSAVGDVEQLFEQPSRLIYK